MAELTITGEGANITAQFNPTEFSLSKGVKIEDKDTTGLNGAEPQFIRGENEKSSRNLFLAATLGGGSVKSQTDACRKLAQIVPSLRRPPIVTVTWGTALSFKAVVESVQRKFTLFDPSGTPLRATVTMSFKEYKTTAELQAELQGQASPHTRRRVVQRGDTLSRIAAEAYQDAAAWRQIVDANAGVITNPRRLEPGSVLIIPPKDPY